MTENKITTNSKNSSIQNQKEVNELIENNMKLVGFISKKFYTEPIEREDLIAVGYIGLIKAAQTFKYEKGNKFATYAAIVISNEIKKHLRKENKKIHAKSIEEVIFYNKNGEKIILEDTLMSQMDLEQDYLEKEEYIILHKAIKELTEVEQEWIYLYYGFYDRRYTGTEISKIYGINQSTFSRNIIKILKKLKTILEEKYNYTSNQKINKINRF